MILYTKNKTLPLHLLFFSFLQISSFVDAKVIEITQEKDLPSIFESKHEAILMGSMNHCSWCIQTKPHFTQLEEKFSPKIKFYSANGPKTNLQAFLYDFTHKGNHMPKEMITALKKQRALDEHNTLRIPGYPTFLYLKHGKIVDIHIGGCSLETLEKFIKKNHTK